MAFGIAVHRVKVGKSNQKKTKQHFNSKSDHITLAEATFFFVLRIINEFFAYVLFIHTVRILTHS